MGTLCIHYISAVDPSMDHEVVPNSHHLMCVRINSEPIYLSSLDIQMFVFVLYLHIFGASTGASSHYPKVGASGN